MRFRIIQSEYARWGDRLEPPRPMFLRSALFAMKQIGLAEDAYDAPLTVDDWKCADIRDLPAAVRLLTLLPLVPQSQRRRPSHRSRSCLILFLMGLRRFLAVPLKALNSARERTGLSTASIAQPL
jgi:hypothetical protein